MGLEAVYMAMQIYFFCFAPLIIYHLILAFLGVLFYISLTPRLQQVKKLKKPLALVGSLAISTLLFPLLDRLYFISSYVDKVLTLLKCVGSTWVLCEGIGLAVEGFLSLGKRREEGSKLIFRELIPLIGRGLQVAIVVIGLLSVLPLLGFNPGALLAGASIGSIGLALATQDAAKNIFSSIIIFLDKPFGRGDTIVAKGILGRVESVGLRATRLRTPQNGMLYVPNTFLSNSTIENKGRNPLVTSITLAANTPVNKLTDLVKTLEMGLTADPDTQANPTIRLESLSKKGILLSCNLRLTPRAAALRAVHQHRLILWVLKKIEAATIEVVAH